MRREPEPRPGHDVLFLVCAEAREADRERALGDSLAAWRAEACLPNVWLLRAPTIARVVYDSLAPVLADEDRLLVAEIGEEALWYNIAGRHREAGTRRQLAR
jgi:hypothetical protein